MLQDSLQVDTEEITRLSKVVADARILTKNLLWAAWKYRAELEKEGLPTDVKSWGLRFNDAADAYDAALTPELRAAGWTEVDRRGIYSPTF